LKQQRNKGYEERLLREEKERNQRKRQREEQSDSYGRKKSKKGMFLFNHCFVSLYFSCFTKFDVFISIFEMKNNFGSSNNNYWTELTNKKWSPFKIRSK